MSTSHEFAKFFQDVVMQFVQNRGSDSVRDVLDVISPEQTKEIRKRPSQDECEHLKGSIDGKTWGYPVVDYAVRDHVFIDGTRNIKCMICGKQWTPDSSDWSRALEMAEQSTNTISISERPK